MDAKGLIALITANGAMNVEAATCAVRAFEEETLDKFVAIQFSGTENASVEVNVSNEMKNKLFERIQNQWATVGRREPYASVLSQEKFMMKNIAENLVEFRNSGVDGIRKLNQLAKKNKVSINFKKCFELGCGVGRMTAHFAEHFESVTGADISPGNIKVCDDYLKELGNSNVELKLLTALTDLEQIENFDVFVSFIAIQHNPPPIQCYMLEKVLAKLNDGGIFLFQTLVHHPTYSYTAESNFSYPPNQDFEMHCLPMRTVLEIISLQNLTLLDVVKDRMGGYGVDSNTFFGIKQKTSDTSAGLF